MDRRSRHAGEGSPRRRSRPGELGSIPAGLLQVVADDFLLPDDRFPSHLLQPVRGALVQLSASDLRGRVVRRVADQQVAEAERILARQRRSLGVDQLLANERHQIRRQALAGVLRYEVPHAADGEILPDDRRRLEHRSLVWREAIQAGGEQRVDRRGDGDGRQVPDHPPASAIAGDEPRIVDCPRPSPRSLEPARLGAPPSRGGSRRALLTVPR